MQFVSQPTDSSSCAADDPFRLQFPHRGIPAPARKRVHVPSHQHMPQTDQARLPPGNSTPAASNANTQRS